MSPEAQEPSTPKLIDKLPDWSQPSGAVSESAPVEREGGIEAIPHNTVSVLRNGKDGAPDYWDDDWSIVEQYYAPGTNRITRYGVTKLLPDGTSLEKTVTPSQLKGVEATPASAPLTSPEAAQAELARLTVTPEAERSAEAIKEAREVGHEAVEQVVEAPDPLAGLSERAKDDVLAYRRILYNINQSTRDKKFDLVAEDKRQLWEVRKSLSSEAKRFLGLTS